MTNRRKLPSVEKTYVDPSGIPSRVLVPEDAIDLSAGIPVSLDISGLYAHMPQEFTAALTKALHEQGLIRASDYFLPGASDKYRSALLMVIRHDFTNLQTIAKAELDTR